MFQVGPRKFAAHRRASAHVGGTSHRPHRAAALICPTETWWDLTLDCQLVPWRPESVAETVGV